MIDETLLRVDYNREKKDLEKYVNYYFLLDFWMKNIEDGKTVSMFFERRRLRSIAIYGMASLGRHLTEQLSESLKPIYTIDNGIISYKGNEFPLEKGIKEIESPDVIVVTPLLEYLSIKKYLLSLVNVEIISLEEVILSL